METEELSNKLQYGKEDRWRQKSFEDVSSTTSGNISSIRLYQISTGLVFTAVSASTQLQSAFLSDIDGLNVVYTSAASGNYDIYLFQFTAPQVPLMITTNSTSRFYGYAEPALTASFSSNGTLITPDLTKLSGTPTPNSS